MGCTLRVNGEEGVFACPCHGAEFDFEGHFHNPREYFGILLSLPLIMTRVRGETVEAFGA
jgi:Rieske Fe-S protein